jgi:hypothetical protein
LLKSPSSSVATRVFSLGVVIVVALTAFKVEGSSFF